MPHRLTSQERIAFELAKAKGYLELGGSVSRTRSQRSTRFVQGRTGNALWNTFRNWCDACAVPLVCIHRARDGGLDELVVDVSPVRPVSVDSALRAGKEAGRAHGVLFTCDAPSQDAPPLSREEWHLPLHKLPELRLSCTLTREEAKSVAGQLSQEWACKAGAVRSRRRLERAKKEEPSRERDASDASGVPQGEHPRAFTGEAEAEAAAVDGSQLGSAASLQEELDATRQELIDVKGTLLWEGSVSPEDANKKPEVVERVAKMRKMSIQVSAATRLEKTRAAFGGALDAAAGKLR